MEEEDNDKVIRGRKKGRMEDNEKVIRGRKKGKQGKCLVCGDSATCYKFVLSLLEIHSDLLYQF